MRSLFVTLKIILLDVVKAVVVFAFVVGAAAYFFLLGSGGFGEADIKNVKTSIRTEYEANGATIEDIVMMKESSTKLIGFAKLQVGGVKLLKDCSATMDADNKRYVWKCQ